MSQSSAPSTDDPTARIPLGGLERPMLLLGRRDQASAAYTAAEYRALATIPGVEVIAPDTHP